MKAVVVEVNNSYVAVLQEDGCIAKLKNTHLQIGDIVHMKKTINEKNSHFKHFVSAAAVLILVVSAGIFSYAMPVYYVSVDVNPSILLKANMFERIIGVEAVNDDALPIIDELDLNNSKVEKAVTKVMARLNEKGYFETPGTDLVIATASKDDAKSEKLAQKLEDAADEVIAQEGTEVLVDSRGAGYDMVQTAKELGITPGKLNIITHVLGFETPEEYQPIVDGVLNGDYSMKDLMSVYKQTKSNNGKSDKTDPADGEKVTYDGTDANTSETPDSSTSTEESNGNSNGNNKGNSKALGTTKDKTSDEDTTLTDSVDDQDEDSTNDTSDEDEDNQEEKTNNSNNSNNGNNSNKSNTNNQTITTDQNTTDDSTQLQEDTTTTQEQQEISSSTKDERKELLNKIKESKHN